MMNKEQMKGWMVALLTMVLMPLQAQVISKINTEQEFVNYLAWLGAQPAEVRHDNINAFYGSLSSDSLRAHWYVLATSYLTDAESPMRNEALFSSFLRSRFGLLADSLAATVIGKDAVRDTSLSQARPRVLFVYDPDCDHCMEVIAQERQSPNLKGRVWAVCVTDAGQATRCRRVDLPASWQSVTHDTSLLNAYWLEVEQLPVVYYFP